jgi:hypothetical protein
VLDCATGASVKHVLLVGIDGTHGSRASGSGRRAGALRPVIAIGPVRRSVPEDVLNGSIGTRIEDVLLIGFGGS